MLKFLKNIKRANSGKASLSDSQIKDAHFLFRSFEDNPVKNILYNPESIEKALSKTRFSFSSHAEREYILTTKFLEKLGHNINRIQNINSSTRFQGLSPNSFTFKEPKLAPHLLKGSELFDYTVFYSKEIDNLQKNPVHFLSVGQLSNYHFNEADEPIKNVSKLLDMEQAFDKTNYVANLQPNQICVCNIPSDFDLFNFKREVLYRLHATNGVSDKNQNGQNTLKPKINVIPDAFSQPALLKISFADEQSAKFFKEKLHNMKYHNSTLKVYTNEDAGTEAYENRTVVFQGFDSKISETEFLITVQQFAKISSTHFPIKLNFNKIPFTSEVRNYIETNKGKFPADIKIVVAEFNGSSTNEMTIYEPEIGRDEDLKFFIDGETKKNVNEYSFETVYELRQKENKDFIKKVVRAQNTWRIQTLSDSFKLNPEKVGNKSPKKLKSDDFEYNFLNLSTEQKKEFLQCICKNENESESSLRNSKHNEVLVGNFNWPIQAKAENLGWCLVTFPSIFEAKKAIYGMKFMSHFEKLSVDLLANKHFFEFFDSVNAKIFSQILRNQEIRKGLISQVSSQNEQELLDQNIKSFKQKGIQRVHDTSKSETTINVGSQYQDYQALKVKEQNDSQLYKKKDQLKATLRKFMDTFSLKENFGKKPHLEPKIVGLDKVDEVMSSRGRNFGQFDADEQLHILQKRIHKSSEAYQNNQTDRAQRLVGELKELVQKNGYNPKEVADVLDHLSLEYGFQQHEAHSFRKLLEASPKSELMSKADFDNVLGSMAVNKKTIANANSRANIQETRKQIFEKLGRLADTAKMFSTAQKSFPKDAYLQIYKNYYQKLESKITGDFFKTREFKEYLIDTFLRTSEK